MLGVYLSPNAKQHLKACGVFPSAAGGFLIGHKRGQRFFIESIFPSAKSFSFSLKKFLLLNEIFNDKVIGFFSFQDDEKKKRKIMTPFATGKLYLEVKFNKENALDFLPFVIEYKDAFCLTPIHFNSNPQA